MHFKWNIINRCDECIYKSILTESEMRSIADFIFIIYFIVQGSRASLDLDLRVVYEQPGAEFGITFNLQVCRVCSGTVSEVSNLSDLLLTNLRTQLGTARCKNWALFPN